MPNSRRLELGRGSPRAYTSRHQQRRGCHCRQLLALRYGSRRSAPTRTLIWRLSWRISGRLQMTLTNASRRRTHPLRCSMTMTTMTRTRPSTSSCQLTTLTSNSWTSPLSSPPPPPLPYTGAVVPFLGGKVCCRLPTCCRLLSRLPSRHKRRHANLNGLVAALVVGTDLGHPITWTRPFPPTLNQ